MSDDLVEWLRAQLDVDERVATEALEHPARWTDTGWERTGTDDGVWTTRPGRHGPGDTEGCRIEGIGITIYDEGGHGPEQARHIARHDPARVLREVEAKRRILDAYGAAFDRRARHPEDLASAGALLEALGIVKLLALPYADRSGYRPEWQPVIVRYVAGPC